MLSLVSSEFLTNSKKRKDAFYLLAHPQCSPPLRIMRTLWSLYQMRTTQGIGLEAGGLMLEAVGEGLEADSYGLEAG